MNKQDLIRDTYLTLLKVAVDRADISSTDMVTGGDKLTASALGENLGQLAAFIGSAAYDEIQALCAEPTVSWDPQTQQVVDKVLTDE